ncbi:MAG: DUF3307 domain-containing protein [Anaerolineae bacterium]|nr:DUF3307 domain-containing protein [Anaerolineae bacterium]
MLIPHLMFAHMLADYALQTNWLVSKKSEGWFGLLLHGGTVGFMSLFALAPYIDDVWFPLVVMVAIHTLQDYLKVHFGPQLKVHAFFPYMADQVLHYGLILVIQAWAGGSLSPKPAHAEILFMWVGTAVIFVTRYYEVTWWANWLDMIPYMNRWRVFGYAERIAMMTLAVAGLWIVAPLCIVPRLFVSYRIGAPIWQQRRGMLEMGLGVVVSVLTGLGLRLV